MIDKFPKLWYNSISQGAVSIAKKALAVLCDNSVTDKFFEKLFKNPLTNSSKCDIIIMSRGKGSNPLWQKVR
jgi:hypothetical protein